MISNGRRTLSKRQASRRPISSIPKRENSIYFDLQVLYSHKNVLQNIIEICESKIDSARHELAKVNREIDGMESYICINRNEAQTGPGYYKPCNVIGNNIYKIEVVDMEY
jgi:hypothetical protein